MSNEVKELTPIKFNRKIGTDFAGTLNKRVRQYFKENDISKHANANMVLKTIFMISLYFVPLGFLISGVITNFWVIFGMYMIMGLGTAGIGLSIMHDANHGAYSKNENVNKYLGKLLNLIGGYAPTWKIQHNVLHHTYTNIHGYDEDVSPAISILRFSPDDKRIAAHKFQYIYAWFFYGMMTIMWIINKDFAQLFRYKKMNLTKTEDENFGKLLAELIFSKVFYYGTAVVLPILILPIDWWWIPIFILLKHFLAGFILGIIFQPAHVVPETTFVQPESDSSVENNFAIHQMETTSNFAPASNVLYWLCGGLNYQVEHHLFPNICHVHYKSLSKIVKETAEEFGVPYNSHKTFFSALYYHGKMLKQLGEPDSPKVKTALS